jgi:ubiquinone/menaquinone biosynthesis C-methylase UbiE
MQAIWSAEEAREIFDLAATTYDRDNFFHLDDVRHFVAKAAIQDTEHVLDLGTGTGWVAQAARCYSKGRIVGVDISRKMVEEARRQAADAEANIPFLVGDMITLQGLDNIKASVSAMGYNVITCLWAFSNIPHDRRVAMLQRWKDFLTPNGRIVFHMQHPQHDLATYDALDETGVIRYRWKFSDQQSVTECAEACKAIGEEAGLKLLGELEESRTDAYVDGRPAMQKCLENKGNFNPTRFQLEAVKTTAARAMGTFFWQEHNIPGRLVLQHKCVSVVGVWQVRT